MPVAAPASFQDIYYCDKDSLKGRTGNCSCIACIHTIRGDNAEGETLVTRDYRRKRSPKAAPASSQAFETILQQRPSKTRNNQFPKLLTHHPKLALPQPPLYHIPHHVAPSH